MVSLTIEQQEIVDFQGDYLVVNAYAGTGKTTVLNAFEIGRASCRERV